MAAPVEQVGVIIACDGCGQEVLQKTMIPMSVLDKVMTYRCVACARKEIMTSAPAA
jgi:DNA-directed RNA polymerase subunit RPC12/RpoP